METSPRPLFVEVFLRIGGALTAARNPLEAGEANDICMLGYYSAGDMRKTVNVDLVSEELSLDSSKTHPPLASSVYCGNVPSMFLHSICYFSTSPTPFSCGKSFNDYYRRERSI